MVIPIPTPDWWRYVVAVVVVFSLASSSLAAKIQRNVGNPKDLLRFLGLHCLLMTGILALAVFSLRITMSLPESLSAAFWQFLTGLVFGHLALASNKMIMSWSQRLDSKTALVIVLRKKYQMALKGEIAYLILLSLIAVLEEVLFRGVLVELSFLKTNPTVVYILIAVNVPCFALTHVNSGLTQVLAILPLSTYCLVSVLVFQNLLTPVLIHIYFNLAVSGKAFFKSSRR